MSVVNRLGNPANVWLSGSLKKKGRHWFSRWNEYWFVLYKGVRELRYYKRVVRCACSRALYSGCNAVCVTHCCLVRSEVCGLASS